jgi:hypothetical protein
MAFTGTFDGPNRLIILPAGVTSVVVGQVYSAWKQWVLAGNANFVPAFTSDGGGVLVAGQLTQGSYFCLQNQDVTDYQGTSRGWRIRPAEENATVYWEGNLAAADTTEPLFVPTLGGFTSLQLGLQPVTQGTQGIAADVDIVKQAVAGKIVISLDDQTIDIYEEDGVSVLRTLTVSADGRTRTVN